MEDDGMAKSRMEKKTTTARAKAHVRRAARSLVRATQRATTTAKRAVRKATRRPQSAVTRAPSTHMDAIALLKADHKELRRLLSALKETHSGGERQSRLLAQVENALKTHTKVEEEIFYPAFRDAAQSAKDRQLFFEAQEEHHAVDTILPEVASVTSEPDVFAARAKVLKEIVEHHAEEEETDMFPRARKLFPPAELRRLGDEIAARKRTLQHRSSGPLGTVASLFSS